MSSELNVILHNIDTTEKEQHFLGQPRQKYHNLEFITSPTTNFGKHIADKWKLKVTKFQGHSIRGCREN